MQGDFFHLIPWRVQNHTACFLFPILLHMWLSKLFLYRLHSLSPSFSLYTVVCLDCTVRMKSCWRTWHLECTTICWCRHPMASLCPHTSSILSPWGVIGLIRLIQTWLSFKILLQRLPFQSYVFQRLEHTIMMFLFVLNFCSETVAIKESIKI